jgi:hypothetical protein
MDKWKDMLMSTSPRYKYTIHDVDPARPDGAYHCVDEAAL